MVPMVTAPFIMNFMLPVPLASLPAVEICSEMSVAGIRYSAGGDAVIFQEDHVDELGGARDAFSPGRQWN